MHCCQSYNKQTCTHSHRYRSLVYHYHRYFHLYLSNNRSRRYRGYIYLYCMLHLKFHPLIRKQSNQSYRCRHNLQYHTHIQEFYIQYHTRHRQANFLVILVLNSHSNSHYGFQSSRLHFIMIQRYLDQYRNCNQESCIPDRKSHPPERHLIIPCFKSYLLNDNFKQVFMNTTHI